VASLVVRLPDLQKAMYRAPSSNVDAYRALLLLVRAQSRLGIDVMMDQLRERDEATIAALEHASPRTSTRKPRS
jgi:hypothetical protein